MFAISGAHRGARRRDPGLALSLGRPNAGGGTCCSTSIAAAVIGGTSLFGGRGGVRSALLGALVIARVANGMGLLGYSAGVQFLVTGIILLAAVTVDTLSRRRLAVTAGTVSLARRAWASGPSGPW